MLLTASKLTRFSVLSSGNISGCTINSSLRKLMSSVGAAEPPGSGAPVAAVERFCRQCFCLLVQALPARVLGLRHPGASMVVPCSSLETGGAIAPGTRCRQTLATTARIVHWSQTSQPPSRLPGFDTQACATNNMQLRAGESNDSRCSNLRQPDGMVSLA